MSQKKPTPDRTHEDRALWHKVAETIVPLPSRLRKKLVAAHPAGASVSPDPKQESLSPQLELKPSRKLALAPELKKSLEPKPPAALSPHPVTGQQAGVDASTLAKFKSGKMPIAARLDLHGFTQDEAHHAISRFIRESYHNGRRCVLIITGKGAGKKNALQQGTLQSAVPKWLKEASLRPLILSLCSAQPLHGGNGALYLLLKRRR